MNWIRTFIRRPQVETEKRGLPAANERFPPEPLQMPVKDLNPLLLPPLTLAYVGDSVFELYVRSRLIAQGRTKVGDLHRAAVRYVRASAQAETLREIAPHLSDTERDVVRRGRNAKGHAAPKSSSPGDYAAATAFEALLGFLYLSRQGQRLEQLLQAATRHLEEAQNGKPSG